MLLVQAKVIQRLWWKRIPFPNPTDEYEGFSTMKSLCKSHTCDAKSIHSMPVEYTSDLILHYLTHIYNLALRRRVYFQQICR